VDIKMEHETSNTKKGAGRELDADEERA